MTFWTLLNATLGAAVAFMLAYKLFMHSEWTACAERIGMALIGAALILNIGPILARAGMPYGIGPQTPFDDWASALLRIGLVTYFGARTLKHWRANQQQIAISKHWMNKRGGK